MLRKIKFAALCVLLFIAAVSAFMVKAYIIPSGSMIPALGIEDRILAVKHWSLFSEPSRGAVYIFRFPGDREKLNVKRVIAVPGDVVDIKDGVVIINGQPIEEPYVKNHDRFTMTPGSIYSEVPFTVPKGEYFMLGDNRSNSMDSRYFGCVPAEDIIGPVFFRYWPLNRIGIPR